MFLPIAAWILDFKPSFCYKISYQNNQYDQVLKRIMEDPMIPDISMTKVAKLYETEKDAAIAEKDAAIAEKDDTIAAEKAKRAKVEVALAEKDAKIAAERLKTQSCGHSYRL